MIANKNNVELKEFIKKYQGKYFEYNGNVAHMYMKVVKVGESNNQIYPYFTICNFIIYSANGKNSSMYPETTEHGRLMPFENYGWKRITKFKYDTAKNRHLKKWSEYVGEKEKDS